MSTTDSQEITRNELSAIVQRLDAADERQNKRLDNIDQICQNVAVLATNMKLMLSEQQKINERIGVLEKADGQKWRWFVESAIAAVVGGIVAFILCKIGLA